MIVNQSATFTPDELARLDFACEHINQDNRFLSLAASGHNVFLTGMAGTGKSTLLKQFIKNATSFSVNANGELKGRRVDVTAPTGVAALNVGGMTIHRFCGMMLGPQAGQTNEQYFEILRQDTRRSVLNGFKRVRNCQCLVIDEISMLPGRQLDFVEYLFRRLRDIDEPFGGCQVVATGDFLQLPPVRHSDSAPYDWAFLSPAWERAGFYTVILDKVRRQDEPDFVRALADFREGRIVGSSAALLQGRVKNFPASNLTRLFTHNVQVDKWNNFQLGELPGDAFVFPALKSGPEAQVEFLQKNLLTPETLMLKPGAVVMFTVNKNPNAESPVSFVNGQVGVIEDCDENGIILVRTKDSSYDGLIQVEPFTWQYSQNDDTSGKFTQYPLRLAWAMTIHKSQGLTLDSAYVDIRAAREPGQAYVAVSRVRTLAGLNFKEWPKGVFVSPEAVKFYREVL